MADAGISAPISRSRWMEALSREVGPRTLRELVIPGAHDAGTAQITDDSGWSPEVPTAIRILAKPFMSQVAGWSRAQRSSLYHLLDIGIRYFDLRVAKAEEDERLYFAHSLLGGLAGRAICDIATFLDTHDREIVILDFQHFQGLGDRDHSYLSESLNTAFGRKLVPPPATGEQLPTLDAIWADRRQVVLLYSPEDGGAAVLRKNPAYWNRLTYVRSKWCETIEMDRLHECLRQEITHAPADKLFILQAVLSPNLREMTESLAKKGSYDIESAFSLQELALQFNGTIFGWFIGPWATKSPNVIMADWCQAGDLVGKTIELNRRLL